MALGQGHGTPGSGGLRATGGTRRPAPVHTSAEDWGALLQQVLKANPDPQDPLDVTALLESFGWTDHRAQEQGHPDLFSMGRELYQDIRTGMRHEPLQRRAMPSWLRLSLHVVVQFPHGLSFALPMIVSFAAMITLRISLSSYLYFSVAQATAMALATFLSFVATGGFVQSMSNSVYVFLSMNETALARATAWRLMRWGLLVALVLAVLLLGGDLVVPVMPLSLVVFMDVYMVLLSAMWLAFAGLYVLRREQWLTLITLGGVLLTWSLWRLGLPVVLAQAIALVCTALAALGLASLLLAQLSRKHGERSRIVSPRASQLAYVAWPYFAYGVLYFTFIFVDRLVSWSTNNTFMPYYIWFRGEYELGMDWALLALVLPLGTVEVLIHYVSNWLQGANQAIPARDVPRLARGMRAVYTQCLAVFSVGAVASLVLTRQVVVWVAHWPPVHSATPTTGVESFVFTWAGIAYIVLAAGLFNVLVLFSLLHPLPALRLVTLAIATDFLVGIVLTRLTGHEHLAVLGLLAGSVFLLAGSTRAVLRALPEIDYLLFRMV